MNRAEAIGVPKLGSLRRRTNRLSRDLTSFLNRAAKLQTTSAIDYLGLLLLTQETLRFRAILALIKNNQVFSAAALLRGLWESRTILRYLLTCYPDHERACEAYILYIDFMWSEKVRKTTTAPAATQDPSVVADAAECRARFDALDDQLKKLCLLTGPGRMKDLCIKLDRHMTLPTSNGMTSWSHVHEYEHIFAPYSDAVHGGLIGSEPMDAILHNNIQHLPDDLDNLARGYLMMACSYMKEITTPWLAIVVSPELKRLADED